MPDTAIAYCAGVGSGFLLAGYFWVLCWALRGSAAARERACAVAEGISRGIARAENQRQVLGGEINVEEWRSRQANLQQAWQAEER